MSSLSVDTETRGCVGSWYYCADSRLFQVNNCQIFQNNIRIITKHNFKISMDLFHHRTPNVAIAARSPFQAPTVTIMSYTS